jgi:predicted P-loop ATPase
MMLHHQHRGAKVGYDKWCAWSQQSEKFNAKDSRAVWRSFKGARDPQTMRSMIAAAKLERAKRRRGEVDEIEDAEVVGGETLPAVIDDLSDLLGDPIEAKATAVTLEAADILGPTPATDGKTWMSELHLTEDGSTISNLPNIGMILANDVRLKGCIGFNEFTQTVCLARAPQRIKTRPGANKKAGNLDSHIWTVRNTTGGDRWTKAHRAAVRELIEMSPSQKGYGIKVSDRDMMEAVENVAHRAPFHPIRDLLAKCEREDDGRRGLVETLFIRHFKAPDTPYVRQMAINFMVGAIARVFEPGCKFDYVIVLEGHQGIGKSSWIKLLCFDFYGEISGSAFDEPKKIVEMLQGKWFVELGELAVVGRSDLETLKSKITLQADTARMSYAPEPQDFPRQCIWTGTVNKTEYLFDPTGNRRFWPVPCLGDSRGPVPRSGRHQGRAAAVVGRGDGDLSPDAPRQATRGRRPGLLPQA